MLQVSFRLLLVCHGIHIWYTLIFCSQMLCTESLKFALFTIRALYLMGKDYQKELHIGVCIILHYLPGNGVEWTAGYFPATMLMAFALVTVWGSVRRVRRQPL